MNELFLFTDGSVNTSTNVGYGAFLALTKNEIEAAASKPEVSVKRFEETSSTKLEIQTLLWALNEVRQFHGKIIVYTDSQNIIGLPGRRERLERNDFHSKTGRRINNFELYQQFFQALDELNCEFNKIKGHKKTSVKDDIDKLFTLVDRASRNAVRVENSGLT